MKKLFLVVSFLMVLVLAPMAMADQVSTVGGYGPYQTGSGGEFTLKPDAGLSWVLSFYVVGTTSNLVVGSNNFQTFCVENSEYINPNTTYNASISDHSINTGVKLTKGAAYLYHQFQLGTLSGYDYSLSTPARYNDGVDAGIDNDLQQAIWYFMGVGGDPGNSNQFRNDGNTAGGLADNNGLYPVAVLNIWNLDGSAAQDMLVCVPEPATMLLLGSGLIGLAGFARRRFKK